VLLSDIFPILNSLKEGDALSPLLFNIASEYVISRVQENRLGLKFSGSHQLLVSAYDITLLRDNINTKTHTQSST
jgi:hypothetical protein